MNDRLEKKGRTAESTWQHRFTTAIGVLLLAIGIIGVVFTLGLPPIMGFWQA